MASTPRQLNLDELRRLKWLLGGVMALVSLWTVFFLDVEALTLVVIVTGLVTATLIWPQLPARVPALAWRLGVPAIIAAGIADFTLSADTMPVMIRLGVLLVTYRAVSYRRKREDLQLIVLGLFLIIVAGVVTVSLGFAFLLLSFTACALGFLFVVTLIDMSEQTAVALTYAEMSQSPAWARGSWGKLFSRVRAVADWRLIGFAGGLFALVVLFSTLLFVIIPRFEIASGFFLDKYITRKSRTGFSDVIRLGSVAELAKDDGVAMRIDLSDGAQVRDNPYLRMVVLDEYSPEGFKMSTRLKGQLGRPRSPAAVVRGRAPIRSGTDQSWTFYIEPGVSRFLPMPGEFGVMRMRDAAQIQVFSSQQLFALRVDPPSMTAFQLDHVMPGTALADREFASLLAAWQQGTVRERERSGYDPRILLRTPVGTRNEEVLARLLQEITRGEKLSAVQFAERATAWLRARHAYAMSANIPRGEGDDIVKWLDSNEVGFCEYFAAGLTVLSRAAGHPARVIAGFHGGSLNAFENYFMVRNSNAHAWAEVFDGTSAWLRVDATPGASSGVTDEVAATAAQRAQDSSWSARLDSLRVLWYRRVVNFDSRAQLEMLDQVKSLTASTGDALRAQFEALSKRLKTWIGKPWDGKRVGRLAFIAAVGALWLWSMVRVLRWLWWRWRGWQRKGEFDPVRHDAGRWLARLRERRVKAAAEADDARTIGELQRIRYGRRETWPEPRAVFKRARRINRA